MVELVENRPRLDLRMPRLWAASDRRRLRGCQRYEGFFAAARRAVALGYERKFAIHPSQIDLANEVFSPTEREIEQARRVVAAMEQARDGKAAVQLDGRMVDIANVRIAQQLMHRADEIVASNKSR